MHLHSLRSSSETSTELSWLLSSAAGCPAQGTAFAQMEDVHRNAPAALIPPAPGAASLHGVSLTCHTSNPCLHCTLPVRVFTPKQG